MLLYFGATGIMAHEFRSPRWLSHVVDPDQNGRFMEERHGIPFKQARYEPGLFGHGFELVTLVYVLEHVADPAAVLESLKGDLGPDSTIFIEVPDAIAFGLKSVDDDIFNACHLWMFCPSTLARLLDRCGYESLAIRRLKTRRGHYAMMLIACLKWRD